MQLPVWLRNKSARDTAGRLLKIWYNARSADAVDGIRDIAGYEECLKMKLNAAAKEQAERLRCSLIADRSWTVSKWRPFVDNPFMRMFARSLVWCQRQV